MNHFLDLDSVRDEMKHPYPAGRMSPEELGDSVARLVWESFSDHMVEPGFQLALIRLGVPMEDGVPDRRPAEELLIFLMWAHSRAVQLSFVHRGSASPVRETLDHLHRAIFEDMVTHGTPKAQIPVFEQRVSARYSEYYTAAEISDDRVGKVALDHLLDGARSSEDSAARLLTELAIEVANPLMDFLEGVELTDRGTSGSAG
jgi:hypothetical protein